MKSEEEGRIIFLEGLPGVGKTTIVNAIENMNLSNVHTVNEIVVNLKEKTPVNQNIFITNDNKKINMYNSGTVIIDRGPISTLSYNQTRAMIDKSFSALYIERWFEEIKEIYNRKNVEVIFLTTNGEKYMLPYENNYDSYGSLENQKLLEKVTINNCKKYVSNLKIVEYHQKNMEELINEIIN